MQINRQKPGQCLFFQVQDNPVQLYNIKCKFTNTTNYMSTVCVCVFFLILFHSNTTKF